MDDGTTQPSASQSSVGESEVRPAFHIGIAMAGAVSAGAYTAGVFDFLIEALSEWEAAKEKAKETDRKGAVSDYDVFISVIAGASAGGVVGALSLVSLSSGIKRTDEPAVNSEQKWDVRRVLPSLYDAWVQKPRLFGTRQTDDAKSPGATSATRGAGLPQTLATFLDTRDLDAPATAIPSLLDSTVLTQIARDAISEAKPCGKTYSFFTNPTHLFLTLTNLDGVPYKIGFSGKPELDKSTYGVAGPGHTMQNHADRAHYAVFGIGKRPFPEHDCQWLSIWGDRGISLDLQDSNRTHRFQDGQVGLEKTWEDFIQSALATGAFPFGLKPRAMSLDRSYYSQRAWLTMSGASPEGLELSSRNRRLKQFIDSQDRVIEYMTWRLLDEIITARGVPNEERRDAITIEMSRIISRELQQGLRPCWDKLSDQLKPDQMRGTRESDVAGIQETVKSAYARMVPLIEEEVGKLVDANRGKAVSQRLAQRMKKKTPMPPALERSNSQNAIEQVSPEWPSAWQIQDGIAEFLGILPVEEPRT